jgi:hypothetical protein
MSQSTASLGGVFELSRNLRLRRQHRERQVRLPVGVELIIVCFALRRTESN